MDQKARQRAEQLLQNPRVRVYLDTVAASEGTAGRSGGGYRTVFGGGELTDLSQHPNQRNKYQDRSGKLGTSTAAGRYQFLHGTWKDVSNTLGLKDFSPQSQDLAAVYLMMRAGAIDDILNDRPDAAIRKLNGTWTSLPGSVEGQKHHGVNSTRMISQALNNARAKYGLSALSVGGQTTSPNAVPNAGTFFQQAVNRLYGDAQSVPPLFRRNAGMPMFQGVPINMDIAGQLAISANMELTPANVQELEKRLYANNDETYGVSYVAGGLRPTITRRDATGQRISLIEYPNDVYINAVTGERVTREGKSIPEVIDMHTDTEHMLEPLGAGTVGSPTSPDLAAPAPNDSAPLPSSTIQAQVSLQTPSDPLGLSGINDTELLEQIRQVKV